MVVLFCLLFLFTFTPLFSSSLEWHWSTDDTAIKYYRYRTSNNDDWTVLDSTTTKLVTDDTVKTIELQASYDGMVWSGSSIGTYSKTKEATVKIETDAAIKELSKADLATPDETTKKDITGGETSTTEATIDKEVDTINDDAELNPEDICFVTVTWDNDSDYNFFRYQRDSEEEDGWIVKEGSIESTVLPYHKGLNTYYIQSSWDGITWSESSTAYYRDLPEPHLRVVVESLVFSDEDPFSLKEEETSISVIENEADSNHLSYSWDVEGYNWLKFRVDDEPWYVVDTHTSGAVLRLIEDYDKEGAVFQIKGSKDGKKWSERIRVNDKDNKYNEDYMDRSGWMLSSGFSVYYPYLVAFFTPSKGTINYTTPRELTTKDISVSFGCDISSRYETVRGNSYGFRLRYLYSPTHKNTPYTSTSLELLYSRLLVRTPRYNTFQLWLGAGLGPSLCLFENTGSIGISLSLGLETRFTFSNNLVLSASYSNTVIIEPNINDNDQLTLGTTFYTTLPLKVGISYSFKSVGN